MGVISRGIKNAFRNTVRTISITFILGLSIAMSLIMLLALKTVQAKIDTVKGSIGNTITVSPAGVRGFEGGGELLTEQNSTDIATIPHVSKVIKVISDRLTTSTTTTTDTAATTTENNTTSLASAIDPGSFGERQQNRSGNGGGSIRQGEVPRNMTMPISVTATNDLDSAASINASKFDITSGAKFDVNSTDNVAMIGTELATKNNLAVGGTFKAYDKDITVVGIFDSGNKFTNAGILMPVKALQTLSDQTDQINSMTVQTDSVDSLSSVQDGIKSKLGSDKVDVVSSQETATSAVAPLENIKTISTYSLIGSLVAGSVIILLTMVMIVRERRREIGVLKAIGSSNIKVMSQFTVESLVLTLTSSVLGMILGVIFSNPVLKVLVTNSESSGGGNFGPGGGGGRAMGAMMRFGGNAADSLRNIQAVVDYKIILYGIGAAIIIAIIGSAIPAFFIAKIRPAEVMRAE